MTKGAEINAKDVIYKCNDNIYLNLILLFLINII